MRFACERRDRTIYDARFAHTNGTGGEGGRGWGRGCRRESATPPAAPGSHGSLGDGCMSTSPDPLLRHVLRDEALTRGLGDIEARMLVEWLTDWTELLAEAARTDDDAWSCVKRLCRRG